MATTLETDNSLNPVRLTDRFGVDTSHSVLFLGGWEQNPDYSALLQAYLKERGIASAGFSAFDVIDPVIDPSNLQFNAAVRDLMTSDELLSQIPPRMIKRATTLLELTRNVMQVSSERPADWTVTHCAGANVALIAHYLERQMDTPATLPTNLLLMEPMVGEGYEERPRDLGAAILKQARSSDERVILLQKLRHPNAPNLGTARAQPLMDICRSKGITFLARMADTLNLHLVFGQEDLAAPADSTIAQLVERGIDLPVTYYPQDPSNTRLGHGFIYDKPEVAADVVRGIVLPEWSPFLKATG